jgi:SAM-dependent methyltransferase
MYEHSLVGSLFKPWAELVVGHVDPRPGERFLDVACGTGIVARVVKERLRAGANIVGVDLNPLMLAVARNAAADIDWRQGDASSLPLEAGEQFEVVVCQQGLQFFPDKPAAVRQMRRALAPGGRLAVSTWRPDEEMPFLRELRRIAERHLGAIVDRRHAFGLAAPLDTLLREAGFHDVRSATRACRVRFNDGSTLVRMNAMALVSMSAASKEMGDDERERIVATLVHDSAAIALENTGEEGLAFEMLANVATARG